MTRWAKAQVQARSDGPPAGQTRSVDAAFAPGLVDALGTSVAMAKIGEAVQRLANQDPQPVLLTGEPGTGKGQVARLLHHLGSRSGERFVQVDCPAIEPGAGAAELFGHAPGALAGSAGGRPGRIEAAHGGTLFLDCLDRLSSEVQHRLSAFLETGTMHRLGGAEEFAVDVRVVAACSGDPEKALGQGALSPELYRRVKRSTLHLPAVRERPEEDRVALIHRLHQQVRSAMHRRSGDVSAAALKRLLVYSWPGNVPEVRNVLERAVLIAGTEATLGVDHLPAEIRNGSGAPRSNGFRPESLETVERRHIEAMLRHHDGNRTRAARDLGIARATLINKIKAYELDL